MEEPRSLSGTAMDVVEDDDTVLVTFGENLQIAGKLFVFGASKFVEDEIYLPKDILDNKFAVVAEYSPGSPHLMNDNAAFAFKQLYRTSCTMANKHAKKIRELEEKAAAMEEAHLMEMDRLQNAHLDALQSELVAERARSASSLSQMTRNLALKDQQMQEMSAMLLKEVSQCRERCTELQQELESVRRQSVNTQLSLQVQDLKHVAKLTHVMRDPADQIIDIVDFPNGFLIRKFYTEQRKKYRYFFDEVIQALRESDIVRDVTSEEVPSLLESLFQVANSFVEAQLTTLEVSLRKHFGVEDLKQDSCAHRFFLRTMQRVRYPRIVEDLKSFQVTELSPKLQQFENVISDMKTEEEIDDSSPCCVVALYQFLVTALLQCRLSDPPCVLHPPPNSITSLDVCERVNQGPKKGRVDSEHMISLLPGLYFLNSDGSQPGMPEIKGLLFHHFSVTPHEIVKAEAVAIELAPDPSPEMENSEGTIYPANGPFDGITEDVQTFDDTNASLLPTPAPFLHSTLDEPETVSATHQNSVAEQLLPSSTSKVTIVRGLPNIGNTCYQNTVLQCIAHVAPLADIFIGEDGQSPRRFPADALLANILSTFLLQYRAGSNREIQQGVRDVKKLMGEIKPALFGGNEQRDAFTLFREMMGQLHSELNSVKIKPYPSIRQSTSANLSEVLLVSDYAWQDTKSRDDSPVSECCFLQRRMTTQCTACGVVTSSFDAQSSLILPIPQNSTVDMLAIQAIAQMPREPQVLVNFEVIASLDTPVGVVMNQVIRTLTRSGYLQDPEVPRHFHVSALQSVSLPGGASSSPYLELARSVNATSSATDADRNVRIGDILGNSNVLVFSQLDHPAVIGSPYDVPSNHPMYVDVSFGVQHEKVVPVVGSIPIRLAFSQSSSLMQNLLKTVKALLAALIPYRKGIFSFTFNPQFQIQWYYLDEHYILRQNAPSSRVIFAVVDDGGQFKEASKFHFTVTKDMGCIVNKVTYLMSIQKRVLSSEELHTQQNPIFRRHKPFTLLEAINAYSKPRRLEGTKCCESCNRQQTLEISYELWRPPKVLVICLTRFEQTGRPGKLTKIDTPCDFPPELDLAGVAPAAARDGESSIFDLYGVGEHSGDCQEGHYMACARDASGQWYRFDDLEVMPIPFEMVSLSQAYFLFYVRR